MRSYRATPHFRRALRKLSPDHKRDARAAFRWFKEDPFDPRLRPHKIQRLSAYYGRTIYAVDIAGDLRATFYIEGQTVWSVDIGTHDVYRG